MLSTLLFDVDGTLAETEEEHRKSFNYAFHSVGLDWVWSKNLYAELLNITGGKERIQYYIERYIPEFKFPIDSSKYIHQLHYIKTEHYQFKLKSGVIKLRPGISRLIQEAKNKKFQLGIVTTTTPKNVTTLLEKSLGTNSSAWFDVIAAGNVVPNKKPASDIYHYALSKLNVGPSTCLAIEDTHNGLLSAYNAGIKTVVTVSQYSKNQDFSKAELVIDHLGEPEIPANLISGDLSGKPMVDLDLLMQISQN